MPLQDMNGGFDPFATGTVGSTHTGGITATIRANNAVYYRSPSLGGVSIHAAIAAGEGQLQGETANAFGSVAGRGDLGAQERPIGLSVRYAGGPLNIGLAYDKNYADIKTIGVYGSFDFGFMKLMGQFEKGDSSNNAGTLLENMKNYSIGVRAPLGPVTILAGYLVANSDLANRCQEVGSGRRVQPLEAHQPVHQLGQVQRRPPDGRAEEAGVRRWCHAPLLIEACSS
jgi:predicted porin